MRSNLNYLHILLLSLSLVAILPQTNAQAGKTITGYVFEDLNQNGTRDANEPGIKGVVVSDQVNIVITNDQGSI